MTLKFYKTKQFKMAKIKETRNLVGVSQYNTLFLITIECK